MERVEHCHADRRAYRWGSVKEDKWPDQIRRSSGVVWSLLDGWDGLADGTVVCDVEKTGEMESLIGILIDN